MSVAPPSIRVIALGVLVHRDHALFAIVRDHVKQWTFHRPIGGTIEFGESAAEAVVREFEEETGLNLEVWASLGVVENRYVYLGHPGHEIVFEFVMRFPAGAAPAGLPHIEVREGEHISTTAWLPLAEVLAGAHPLVPDDLHLRLADWVNSL